MVSIRNGFTNNFSEKLHSAAFLMTLWLVADKSKNMPKSSGQTEKC